MVRRIIEQAVVRLREERRVLIGGAAEHDAVDVREVRLRLVQRADAAVDDDGQLGRAAFSR